MSVKGIYMEEDKKEEIEIVKVTEELIKAKTYSSGAPTWENPVSSTC